MIFCLPLWLQSYSPAHVRGVLHYGDCKPGGLQLDVPVQLQVGAPRDSARIVWSRKGGSRRRYGNQISSYCTKPQCQLHTAQQPYRPSCSCSTCRNPIEAKMSSAYEEATEFRPKSSKFNLLSHFWLGKWGCNRHIYSLRPVSCPCK